MSGTLHTIRMKLDATGRGEFFVDDVEIHGVMSVDVEIRPMKQFNIVRFSVIGPVDVEIESDDNGVAFAELVARATEPVPDSPTGE